MDRKMVAQKYAGLPDNYSESHTFTNFEILVFTRKNKDQSKKNHNTTGHVGLTCYDIFQAV